MKETGMVEAGSKRTRTLYDRVRAATHHADPDVRALADALLVLLEHVPDAARDCGRDA